MKKINPPLILRLLSEKDVIVSTVFLWPGLLFGFLLPDGVVNSNIQLISG